MISDAVALFYVLWGKELFNLPSTHLKTCLLHVDLNVYKIQLVIDWTAVLWRLLQHNSQSIQTYIQPHCKATCNFCRIWLSETLSFVECWFQESQFTWTIKFIWSKIRWNNHYDYFQGTLWDLKFNEFNVDFRLIERFNAGFGETRRL